MRKVYTNYCPEAHFDFVKNKWTSDWKQSNGQISYLRCTGCCKPQRPCDRTPSPSRTPTNAPTWSPTPSPSDSPTSSPTPSPSNSPTPNPTNSPTPSPSGILYSVYYILLYILSLNVY